MIQVAFFKKKDKAEKASESVKEFDYKTEILNVMNEKLKGNLYDGCIIMPRGFTIDVRIGKHEEQEEVKLLQAVFVVEHDDFDEPIIDPVDAQGKTCEEAAKMAVDIFYAGLWHTIDQSIYKKSPIPVTVNYLDQHYEYDMYAQSIVRIGPTEGKQPTMLFKFIQNEIPKYLGSKKYYWFRIYLAKHKEREIIEVRVNGSVCSDLHKFFKPYLDSWDASKNFICEKQHGIFVQRGEDQCPFKKEDVMEAARYVIDKLTQIKTREEYEAMAKDLAERTGNADMAAEVRIFVPEIFAKMTLGYNEGDSLFLLDGDNKIEFRKTQLRSYFYIQQAVLEYLGKRPPQEAVQSIVFKSVAFAEMRKLMLNMNQQTEGQEGAQKVQPKDLFVPGTAYKINSENYKAW